MGELYETMGLEGETESFVPWGWMLRIVESSDRRLLKLRTKQKETFQWQGWGSVGLDR